MKAQIRPMKKQKKETIEHITSVISRHEAIIICCIKNPLRCASVEHLQLTKKKPKPSLKWAHITTQDDTNQKYQKTKDQK